MYVTYTRRSAQSTQSTIAYASSACQNSTHAELAYGCAALGGQLIVGTPTPNARAPDKPIMLYTAGAAGPPAVT